MYIILGVKNRLYHPKVYGPGVTTVYVAKELEAKSTLFSHFLLKNKGKIKETLINSYKNKINDSINNITSEKNYLDSSCKKITKLFAKEIRNYGFDGEIPKAPNDWSSAGLYFNWKTLKRDSLGRKRPPFIYSGTFIKSLDTWVEK